jgi:aspartyl-tRNA(Asn)/glutamyl-tRNA(Gln) amidotransferase subunit A
MSVPPPLTATALRLAHDRRDRPVLETTEAALDAIAALDSDVRAFLAVDATGARTRARELDEALAKGERSGELCGVPIALKDNLCVAGGVTTAGSRILENWRAPYDAAVVSRLRAAGAVLIGKTNLDEFAMGSSCENSAYGPTRNPWDLSRVPGGSSGGSAASVAAGMTPLALGSDTGGSIRQPAALCGVVGFKPTYGRVSRYGLIAFASSLDQIGPITRTVEDARLAYRILAATDPNDSTHAAHDPEAPAAPESIAGLRIGVHRDYVAALGDGEMRRDVDGAIERLVERGAVRVDLDDLDLLTADALAIYYVVATAEASSNLARFDGLRYGPRIAARDLAATYAETRGALFGSEVKRRIVLGTFALSAGYAAEWYGRANQARHALRAAYAGAFARADVIVGAVTPTPAFRLGENTTDPLTMYLCDTFTIPASLAGLPAISVPLALSSEGLPLAAQVIGPAFEDLRVLAVAEEIERSHAMRGRVAPGSGGGR